MGMDGDCAPMAECSALERMELVLPRRGECLVKTRELFGCGPARDRLPDCLLDGLDRIGERFGRRAQLELHLFVFDKRSLSFAARARDGALQLLFGADD